MKVQYVNRLLRLLILAAITGGLSSCQSTPASADEAGDSGNADASWWSEVKSTLLPETYTVPQGTEIRIRLTHAVASDENSSGDQFKGILEQPLLAGDKVLAPKGSEVSGMLQDVEGSHRVKGRAHLTLALNTLKIDDEEYSLEVHPLTFRAAGSKKKDAITIGGSSGVGAIIGAIAGGGDAAAKGAAIGAGAGAGYVLLTKGKEVKLASERRLTFVLSEALELPEAERS